MVGKLQHQPVLLNEVLQFLLTDKNGIYIDATFGRGGHSREILNHLDVRGRLYAIDRDPDAIASIKADMKQDKRFSFEQAAFAELKDKCARWQISGKVNGILLDLGVSSPQLDEAKRGFSFTREGPLDMRMDPTQGMNAREWLAGAKEVEIANVLNDFGEERFARRIARAICMARQQKRIESTLQLAEIIKAANPRWEKHLHPATRSFQAIRIFINRELEQLQHLLQDVIELLAIGGRIAVISFHSLEDRIVKRFMRDQSRTKISPEMHYLPQPMSMSHRLKIVTKAIKPTEDEIKFNPRARSAILRIAEKIS
jgi:16S rRNA (cytosine1402-N4)-methyltransferase